MYENCRGKVEYLMICRFLDMDGINDNNIEYIRGAGIKLRYEKCIFTIFKTEYW